MRKPFVEAFLKYSTESTVFLTGDLGFNALEPVKEALQNRFINAGIAEQNMVSVAAGLAKTGFSPWVYSIAPFCYARPFEQIRNDVCLHNLPVRLIGNGGGYGYGVMGATHHALEDYGVLLTLYGMKAYVPAFGCDLDPIIAKMSGPSYLRLGKCEQPGLKIDYSPWRRLVEGKGPSVVVVGPLVGSLMDAVKDLKESVRPDLWAVTELPIKEESIPDSCRFNRALWVVEEHVSQGSAGQMLALQLMQKFNCILDFRHYCAQGYPSKTYGSQNFHRTESGIDAASIREQLLRG